MAVSAFVVKSIESGVQSLEASLDQITAETAGLIAKAGPDQYARILGASKRLTTAALSAQSEERFKKQFEFRGTELSRDAADLGGDLTTGKLQQAGPFVFKRPSNEGDAALAQRLLALSKGEQEVDARNRQRSIDLLQTQTEYQTKLVELLAGPGGEEFALRRTTDIRLRAVDAAKALGSEMDAQLEKTKILQDAELSRLGILQRQKQAVGESFGKGFDALVSSGAGGIKAFALSGITGLGRQLAVNVGQEVAGSVSGKLALPGQKNADGSPSFLGRLLSNTFLADNSGLKTATDRNTTATELNSAEIANLRSAITAAAGGGNIAGAGSDGGSAIPFGAIIAGVGSALGLPAGVLQGAANAGSLIFPAAPRPSGRSISLGAPELGTFDPGAVFASSAAKPGFFNQYGSTGKTLAVDAAALAGGAFGAVRGIRTGGARGAITAVGSALGAAAAIDPEPVSKTVLALGAIGAAVIASILPDPRKVREAAIDRLAQDSAFKDPGSFDFNTDFSGRLYDTNIRGDVRPINLTVYAMESRNIIDHAEDIADALHVAIRAGHRVGTTIQQEVLQT